MYAESDIAGGAASRHDEVVGGIDGGGGAADLIPSRDVRAGEREGGGGGRVAGDSGGVDDRCALVRVAQHIARVRARHLRAADPEGVFDDSLGHRKRFALGIKRHLTQVQL